MAQPFTFQPKQKYTVKLRLIRIRIIRISIKFVWIGYPHVAMIRVMSSAEFVFLIIRTILFGTKDTN